MVGHENSMIEIERIFVCILVNGKNITILIYGFKVEIKWLLRGPKKPKINFNVDLKNCSIMLIIKF